MLLSYTAVIAGSMLSATASPQITVHVSFEVVDPPIQVHPVSAFHASFYLNSNGFSSNLIGNCKEISK